MINTQGIELKDLAKMAPGDIIKVQYTTTNMSTPGSITKIGNVETSIDEFSDTNLTGWVYFIKLDKGVLMSTKCLMSEVTFDTVNSANLIAGNPITLTVLNNEVEEEKQFLVRIPTIAELNLANSTLNGMLDTAERYDNFNTAADQKEVIQEHYATTGGSYTWNTTPGVAANAASGDDARFARLVLVYPESSKSTDVFH